MEGVNMIDDLKWYKEVSLFNIISSVTLKFSKEEIEIYNRFLSICNQYGKVQASLIQDKYGLDKDIALKVLNSMVDELKILDKSLINDELCFWINKDYLKLKNKKEEEIFYFQSQIRFFICLYPLLLNDKYLFCAKPDEFDSNNALLRSLDKIDKIVQTKNNLKEILKIPAKFCGFNFTEGVKVDGIAPCEIIWKDNQFVLYQNKFKITQIRKEHPDYLRLNEELESIRENSDLLQEKILIEITLKFKIKNFSIEFSKSSSILIINIEEDDLVLIGDIFRIISIFEGNELRIPVKNGWAFKVYLKFKISNPSFNAWINLFRKLAGMIEQNYMNLLNKDLSFILSQMYPLIKELNRDDKSVEFNPSNEDIMTYLQNVANYTNNNWFHLIYAKFLEREVIL